MRNTEHHDHALRQLGSDLVSRVLDVRAFRREVTALLRERFECEQVVLWRVAGKLDDRQLHCVAERHGERVEIDPGHRIDVQEVDGYLQHLGRAGVYAGAAISSLSDRAGAQARRLHPAGARNMLHAGATYNGRFLGIVCCDRRDPARGWTAAEQVDLRRLAARIALYVGTVGECHPELLECPT